MGLTLVILVFIVWESIILFTDIVHWIADTVLDSFTSTGFNRSRGHDVMVSAAAGI